MSNNSDGGDASIKKQSIDFSSLETTKDETELLRKLDLFGIDVGQVPCFRNSFLYGITGGIGIGIAHFAVSSRIQNATRFGFWSYVGITFSYWCYCRYEYTMTKFQYAQLKYAMRESALKEGTPEAMKRT